MIHDHRPLFVKNLFGHYEHWYRRHFLAPQFEWLGDNPTIMRPWNVDVRGACIRAGDNLHVITAPDRRVSFSTWRFEKFQGEIHLGDNCLVCPGVRFDSATAIHIGDNCMFAAGCYLTDADWHDIYDRTRVVGQTRPVTLEANVWIGDGATVCKGVTIGENSVIGAGSVVVNDIPRDSIAAGNPARVVKPLDPEQTLVTRASLFRDVEGLQHTLDKIDRYVLGPNGYLNWLRTLFAPRRGD